MPEGMRCPLFFVPTSEKMHGSISFSCRCGHLADKTVVPVSNMTRKLARAVEASQKASAGNFLICARTDSFAVEGEANSEIFI